MKIAIVGPSGVGKTTIATALGSHYAIKAYEFDAIYWDLTQDNYVKNQEEVMSHQMTLILEQSEWIMEGAYDRRMMAFFEASSVIFRVKTPYSRIVFRLVKRYLFAKLTKKKPIESWKNTIELLKFSKNFEARLDHFFEENPVFLNKLVVVEDAAECIETIDNLDCCGL